MVTNLLNTIEAMRSEGGSLTVANGSNTKLKDASGEDFLFLFDLLAHSCGLESTLRVLTHSDETFYEICKPNIDEFDKLELEEDKLKIKWGPSGTYIYSCQYFCIQALVIPYQHKAVVLFHSNE